MATKKIVKKAAKLKPLKAFTVIRSRWDRGFGCGRLLDSNNNKMCCLGFLCKEMGLNRASILDKGLPSSALNCYLRSSSGKKALDNLKESGRVPMKLVSYDNGYFDSQLTDRIITVNDDSNINDDARETSLKKLFARADIKIKFI